MDKPIEYFTKSQNQQNLKKFIHRLELISRDEFDNLRNRHIINIFKVMIGDPSVWDDKCQINLKQIGENFFNQISNDEVELSVDFLDNVFAYCIRFTNELYLSVDWELASELNYARLFAQEKISYFSTNARNQISFSFYEMPIGIFKAISNNASIKSFTDFNKIANLAGEKLATFEKDLAAREERVNKLKTALNKFENEFNFVGLYDGFNTLSREKSNEKKNLLRWLIVFGILTLLPLATEFAILLNSKTIEISLLYTAIPAASLTAILIYFFRIILQNYKSVTSQILQIELRKTLCRFIQSYADFSIELKNKDKDALSKFENIIFSGIVSDDEKLPSTFDGVEQLGNLIKAIKS